MTGQFAHFPLVILGAITFLTTAGGEPSMMDISQAELALNLLREGTPKGKSSIMSPFSISVALAMVYAGARHKTHDQMSSVLAGGISDSEFHNNMSELLQKMSKAEAGFQLNSANRVYISERLNMYWSYADIIETKYNGQLKEVDFTKSNAVAKEINQWVEEQTHSKIRGLVDPSMLGPATKMMLINAIYFKADWDKQFEEGSTRKKAFYEGAYQQRMIDMMTITDWFPYYEDKRVQVLGLPYKTKEVTMYVFLPKEKFGLAHFTDELTGDEMLEIISKTRNREVSVHFPKFRLEEKFELVNALRRIGITDAFDDSLADFSGITNVRLAISDVVQKAFIEVDEKGTEAAAATGIRIRTLSRRISMPITFTADHPFMFTISYRNTVLFIGKMH